VFRIELTSVREHQKAKTSSDAVKAFWENKKEFERLIVQLENKMYRVARTVLHSDADCADAIQEALLRAWKKMPQLKDNSLFEPWLMRILIRECYRLIGRNKNQSNVMVFEEVYAGDQDLSMDLRRILDTIPYHERIVLILHYTLDYGVNQVAAMLGIPSGTVKSRLARGRQHLAEKIKEETLWKEIL